MLTRKASGAMEGRIETKRSSERRGWRARRRADSNGAGTGAALPRVLSRFTRQRSWERKGLGWQTLASSRARWQIAASKTSRRGCVFTVRLP